MNAVLSPSENKSLDESPSTATDWRFKRLGLSRQESRVIELAMAGRIDKQIAQEIGISLGTVRVYWKRLRFKTGGTRSEAIAKMAKQSLQLDFDELKQRTERLQGQLDLQQDAEHRLKALEILFTSVAFPVAVLEGQDGDVALANESFAKLCGSSSDEIVGNAAFADSKTTKAVMGEVTGKPQTKSVSLRTPDGKTGPLKFTLCGEPGICVVLWKAQ